MTPHAAPDQHPTLLASPMGAQPLSLEGGMVSEDPEGSHRVLCTQQRLLPPTPAGTSGWSLAGHPVWTANPLWTPVATEGWYHPKF